MPRIRPNDQEQISKMAEQMQRDVSIDLFTQRQSPIIVPGVVPCETCTLTEEILADLQPLVPRLSVRTHDMVGESELAKSQDVDRVPTLVLDGMLAGRARFVGAPIGYEFASFLSGVLETGGAAKSASAESLKKLSALAQPVNLKVFVTPT